MNAHELTSKMKEQFVKDATGEKKRRTLEEALQEALDNSTPEHPGSPNRREDKPEDQADAEWI